MSSFDATDLPEDEYEIVNPAPQQETALAQPGLSGNPMDAHLRGNAATARSMKLKLPMMKICYNKTVDGPPPERRTQPEGDFFNSVTGDVWGMERLMLFIMPQLQRAKMPKYKPGVKSYPLCVSRDGEYPMPKSDFCTDPRPGPCETCPDAQWTNGNPPACSESKNLLLWDIKSGTPVVYTARKAGCGPVDTMVSGLDQTIMGLRGQKREDGTQMIADDLPGSLFVPIRVRSTPMNDGQYYIATYTVLGDEKDLVDEGYARAIWPHVKETMVAFAKLAHTDVNQT